VYNPNIVSYEELAMGITYVEGTVSGPSGESESLQFLVDSGANYTLLPEATWKKLGLKPRRKMEFILADGSVVERNVSECEIALEAGRQHTPVVLGEPGDDQPQLGVVTLDELGVVFDPLRRELRQMTARM
jgi:predicted aspartyl protease